MIIHAIFAQEYAEKHVVSKNRFSYMHQMRKSRIQGRQQAAVPIVRKMKIYRARQPINAVISSNTPVRNFNTAVQPTNRRRLFPTFSKNNVSNGKQTFVHGRHNNNLRRITVNRRTQTTLNRRMSRNWLRNRRLDTSPLSQKTANERLRPQMQTRILYTGPKLHRNITFYHKSNAAKPLLLLPNRNIRKEIVPFLTNQDKLPFLTVQRFHELPAKQPRFTDFTAEDFNSPETSANLSNFPNDLGLTSSTARPSNVESGSTLYPSFSNANRVYGDAYNTTQRRTNFTGNYSYWWRR